MQQVRPHHGETLLDGGAQSVRYEGRFHDGSGQPDSTDTQEVADSEIFVMGNDATEFANKVKDSSAEKTEKNVERCRFWRRTFINLENVHGCDDECGDIHGKEFPEENVRHHSKIGGRTRRDQQCGQGSLGKTFMETTVIDW